MSVTTVSSTDPDRWDRQGTSPGLAVDVSAHMATSWDYFAQGFAHYGWDGKGRAGPAVVHHGDRQPLALFDGKRLLFADSAGGLPPAGSALDVVAHEYSHAVIRATANLTQAGESAAVDEGLADLFACLIQQTRQTRQAEQAIWTIGEGMGDQAISDLADPHKSDQAADIGEYQDEIFIKIGQDG